MIVWGIVVAAGLGIRYGGVKQLAEIQGSTLIEHSIKAASSVCSGVVVVVPADLKHSLKATETLKIVPGGNSRSASVYAGLSSVPDEADVIVIHDGVRPLASVSLFEAVIAKVRAGADGAIPAVLLEDTIKVVDADGERVVNTLDRDTLIGVQTPQAFRADILKRAYDSANEEREIATDDATLVERMGGAVVTVPGERRNIKITTPDDLSVARLYYELENDV